MPNTKPYVAAALLCEKLLVEKDGVMTPVRLVDVFYIPTPPNLPENIKRGTNPTALIVLKSGDVTGKHTVSLSLRRPSGQTKKVGQFPVVMEGGVKGVNLVVQIGLEVSEFGVFWLDVLWDGEPLTAIPLTLVEGPKPAAPEQA